MRSSLSGNVPLFHAGLEPPIPRFEARRLTSEPPTPRFARNNTRHTKHPPGRGMSATSDGASGAFNAKSGIPEPVGICTNRHPFAPTGGHPGGYTNRLVFLH